MSLLQRELYEMIFVLPENALKSLKPLLGELLNAAVLAKDPSANIAQMDELDKTMFLRSLERVGSSNYVSFEQAMKECGISADEL